MTEQIDQQQISDTSTADLISLCQRGNQKAFRELVDGHMQYAYSLAIRLLADEDDAKDVVQEAFIRVWKHLLEYDERVKFTTWLYRIVVNLCYDRLKARKRKFGIFDRWNEDDTFLDRQSSNDPSVAYVNNETAEMIKRISTSLPFKQRMVFILRDLHEQTVEEVSSILDMSLSSVKTNLCYARRAVRNEMERQAQAERKLI
jgi:RNA polymerase sigma-70 factor (ECF subfamily)